MRQIAPSLSFMFIAALEMHEGEEGKALILIEEAKIQLMSGSADKAGKFIDDVIDDQRFRGKHWFSAAGKDQEIIKERFWSSWNNC